MERPGSAAAEGAAAENATDNVVHPPVTVARGGWFANQVLAIRSWPTRRWVVVAVLLLPATVLFGWVGGAGDPTLIHPAWSWPVATGYGLVSSLILASYVPAPGSGRRIEVGCSPCAVMAAVAVLAAILLRSADPTSGLRAALCGVVLLAGLRQRLADASSCAAPAPRGR